MTSDMIPYNPGKIPTLPAPSPGDAVEFNVNGTPPWKDTHFSIRNTAHRAHSRFMTLRDEAARAVAGRAWYRGPVKVSFTIRSPRLERSLADYLGGIADALDGSHGATFTYLPVVYEDDRQISAVTSRFEVAQESTYTVRIEFLTQSATRVTARPNNRLNPAVRPVTRLARSATRAPVRPAG